MNRQDPVALLAALRPRTTLAPIGSAPVPPTADQPLVRPSPRRRRRLALGALVTVTALGGAGTATAAGLVPAAFTDAYHYWNDSGTQVDPSTAVALGSVPGPAGLDLVIYRASNARTGWTCVAPVLEAPRSGSRPAAAVFRDGGSRCYQGEDAEAGAPFGVGAGVMAGDQVAFVDVTAGRAASATLTLPDGSTHATVITQGRIYGWLPGTLRATERATLSASTEDGTALPPLAITGLHD